MAHDREGFLPEATSRSSSSDRAAAMAITRLHWMHPQRMANTPTKTKRTSRKGLFLFYSSCCSERVLLSQNLQVVMSSCSRHGSFQCQKFYVTGHLTYMQYLFIIYLGQMGQHCCHSQSFEGKEGNNAWYRLNLSWEAKAGGIKTKRYFGTRT